MVKVDKSNPQIEFSDDPSDLYSHRDTTLADGTYPLTVHGIDGNTGNAATKRSGVESIEILIDGDRVYYDDQA